MRATRANMAGFGTAGSLVAGAAMVFVLASTVVAFRGWPQVSAQPSPATLVASPVRSPAPSSAGRRLAYAAASLRATVPGGVANHAVGGRTVTGQSLTVPHGGVASVVLPAQTSPAARVVPTTTTSTAPCTTCSAAPTVTGGTAQTVNGVAGVLGTTVAQTGQSLGATVSGVANVLASKLAGVSPPLANTVSHTGAAVGSSLTGVSSAAAGVVSGAGTALGGVLSGLAPKH